MKAKGVKTILVDVMVEGRFVRQIVYRHCPLYPLEQEDVRRYVDEKYPSLKGKDYSINFSKQRVYGF